jgi:hypothetical protein
MCVCMCVYVCVCVCVCACVYVLKVAIETLWHLILCRRALEITNKNTHTHTHTVIQAYTHAHSLTDTISKGCEKSAIQVWET